jgi:L-glutamine-phosphate cytidylyltransferase
MKAIIMAAGIGSRLKDINRDRPKCLIEADGISLISRSVAMLEDRNITDISVITGYRSDLIRRELRDRVRFFHNPYFEVTNSIASLWLAKDWLNDDTILMNADLYYEAAVLDTALAQTGNAVMLSDSTRIIDADFRFGVQGSRILKTGNRLTNQETDCEYVGIVRIDKRFIHTFRNRLEEMIKSGDFRNWWEGVLYAFIEDGTTISHKDVDGAFWTEVDHLADYNRLVSWTSTHGSAAIAVAVTAPFVSHLKLLPNNGPVTTATL